MIYQQYLIQQIVPFNYWNIERAEFTNTMTTKCVFRFKFYTTNGVD